MGIYRFHVIMDDGARLYVDGNLLIDGWESGSKRELTQDLGLTNGEHSLRLEYFENRSSATVRLYWEKLSKPSFPDWKAEFWPNKNLSGNPILLRNDSEVDFDWGSKAPAAGLPVDQFSGRWSRTINFAAGLYRFRLRANDGVRFYVDGTRLVDEWHSSDGATVYTVEQYLSGAIALRVEYYESTAAARLSLSWERLSTTLTPSLTGYHHAHGHDLPDRHDLADGDRDAGPVRHTHGHAHADTDTDRDALAGHVLHVGLMSVDPEGRHAGCGTPSRDRSTSGGSRGWGRSVLPVRLRRKWRAFFLDREHLRAFHRWYA